jgi:hypothetical protein
MTPATCGAAKLVPEAKAGISAPSDPTLKTDTGFAASPPGALKARVSPQLL